MDHSEAQSAEPENTGSRAEQGTEAAPLFPMKHSKEGFLENPEVSESTSSAMEPAEADQTTAEVAQAAHAGWNRGISGGLRTSFAAMSKGKSRKSSSRRASESSAPPPSNPTDLAGTTGSPAETEPSGNGNLQQQSPDGAQSESTKATSSPRVQEGNDWTLPPLQCPSDFEVQHKDQSGWEEKFVEWCKELGPLNEGRIKADTNRARNRVTDAYVRWIGTIDGLSKAKAAAARRAAIHYSQENNAELSALFSSTSPSRSAEALESGTSPQGDAAPSPATAASGATGHADAEWLLAADAAHREKYFPDAAVDGAFCFMCASPGHGAAECPDLICRFCHDPEHRSFSCPTRQRCSKCKQLGHSAHSCNEKLTLAPEETECAFCESPDHVDTACHELWKSFSRQPDAARKVRSLPVFCYCCGRQGHYGSACGLNPQRPKVGPWETWSHENCARYIDPASTEVAVIFGDSDQYSAAPDRPDLGKSIVPKRHIFFEEDEDEDEEAEQFIRPPVQKSARVANISFAGHGGGGARGGRRPSKQYSDRNGGSGYHGTQPPLPPGPPPPLPPPSYKDSRRNGGRRRGGGSTSRW